MVRAVVMEVEATAVMVTAAEATGTAAAVMAEAGTWAGTAVVTAALVGRCGLVVLVLVVALTAAEARRWW